MKTTARVLGVAAAACWLASCGGDATADAPTDVLEDNPTVDVAPEETSASDPGAEEPAPLDAPVDPAGDAAGEIADTAGDTAACEGTAFHGFCVRVPGKHVLPSGEQWDLDQLCTYASGGNPGFLYVQATPSVLDDVTGLQYATVGAWVSFGDVAQAVTAKYDGGGNHRNDWCEIDFGKTVLKYYHSSFGYGWRCCQPMDCFQVLDGPAGAVTDNGCGADRMHPVVCVKVQQDGTWADLVDTFAKCAGDPNVTP